MSDEALMKRVLSLYKAPFHFNRFGYVVDSDQNVVADNHIEEGHEGAALRVRGWGRILYMEEPEKLQDAVGFCMAAALTEYWAKNHGDVSLDPKSGLTRFFVDRNHVEVEKPDGRYVKASQADDIARRLVLAQLLVAEKDAELAKLKERIQELEMDASNYTYDVISRK